MVLLNSILLVDDEASFRESTAELLRNDGYRCDASPDAQNALDRLLARSYDLVIADIHMPGNRNLELVEEIQRRSPELPVILVTGYPSTETAINSIHLPVAAYMTKPFPYEELCRQVRETIVGSHGHRTIARVREQLHQCLEELESVQQFGTTTEAGNITRVPHSTLRVLASCVIELVELELEPDPKAAVIRTCKLLDCPRLPYQRNVLREAVRLLNETKRRFKSKELAHVRELLDQLLVETE